MEKYNLEELVIKEMGQILSNSNLSLILDKGYSNQTDFIILSHYSQVGTLYVGRTNDVKKYGLNIMFELELDGQKRTSSLVYYPLENGNEMHSFMESLKEDLEYSRLNASFETIFV